MTGTLGGKRITHDVDATWVLKREYLQFHEVSREKDANGAPAYEAIVLLGWDAKANEYGCLWLDNTAAWDFSAHGLARGKKAGNSIPLVITLSAHESLHTTFRYDPTSDTWELTIDDVTDGMTPSGAGSFAGSRYSTSTSEPISGKRKYEKSNTSPPLAS